MSKPPHPVTVPDCRLAACRGCPRIGAKACVASPLAPTTHGSARARTHTHTHTRTHTHTHTNAHTHARARLLPARRFLCALPGVREYWEFIEGASGEAAAYGGSWSTWRFSKLGTFAWLAIAVCVGSSFL